MGAAFRRGFLPAACVLFLGTLLLTACGGSENITTAGGQAPALKIMVAEPGIYELTAADLQPYGLADSIEQLSLSLRGQAQPAWRTERDGTPVIRFVGRGSDSRYMRENVYLLESAGEVRPMEVKNSLPPSDAASTNVGLTRLSLEQNLRYLPQVETGDHFLWTAIAAPGSQLIEFDVDRPVADGRQLPTTLILNLWAKTEAPPDPDHQIRVTLNRLLLGDVSWDGAGRHNLRVPVPSGGLVAGPNQLLIEAPELPGVVANVVFLDTAEIIYPRLLAPQEDRLAFEGSGGVLQLDGFSGPAAVFDITNPDQPLRVGDWDGGAFSLQTDQGREYLAVGPEGYKHPARMELADHSVDLRGLGPGADYLAIGPTELLDSLDPLLQVRQQSGLQVSAVPLGAIYDQFGHGFSEPEAIQAFIQHTARDWQPAPRFLLLVGDSTYDPQEQLGSLDGFRLPTFLIQTVYGGETASDVPYGQLDDDPWPELAIGRLPARTPAQVRAYVKKALDYETQLEQGRQQNRILAVADNQDPIFRADAQRFLEQFNADFETSLFAPGPENSAPGQAFQEALNPGSLIVAYFGHGSVTQWGRDEILTAENAHQLGQGDSLPIVINMTCLTGLFTHPEVDSLAESLLWAQDSGAVAVLAPTSLTLPTDQSNLSSALAEAIQNEQAASFGEMALRAREKVPTDTPGGRDVMLTFLLFGDPALSLPGN